MKKIITGTDIASGAASAAFVLIPAAQAAPPPAIANVAVSASFDAGTVRG